MLEFAVMRPINIRVTRVSKIFHYVMQMLLLAALSGCASVDFDYPKSDSRVLQNTDQGNAAKLFSKQVAEHPGESGFYPIYEGVDSLALRLLMAERAEFSIDAQYFLIYDDLVGNAFVNALLRAADRGVRVRFLLDDVLAKGLDPALAALDAHDNFEVRIFNPFAHRSARALDVTNLGRVTRRMHNKSFTVDNHVTIIGGRNIAGEYFDARSNEKFVDLDVFAVGPVVPEVSSMFDTYWNHRAAVPVSAFAETPENADAALTVLNEKIARSLEDIEASQYAEAVRSSILDYVASDTSALTWAPYDLVFDSPDKSSAETVDESEFITHQMSDSIGEVKEELFVVTPYFVLLDDEVEMFRSLRERGVDVTVLTNSLASNNHTSVHGGYSPSRKPLLEMGVKLYELRAGLDVPADKPLSRDTVVSTLHAKTFVVDRKSVFIGSFNWNQRSVNRDTELGVIIHSPKIAEELVNRVSAALPVASFELLLNESDKLRWKTIENGQELVLTKEPQSGFWRRLSAKFLRFMPIKSQL
jgi:putative cardiolipin synthase